MKVSHWCFFFDWALLAFTVSAKSRGERHLVESDEALRQLRRPMQSAFPQGGGGSKQTPIAESIPTSSPSFELTAKPTLSPTPDPTSFPTTKRPSAVPTPQPTLGSTVQPTHLSTSAPTPPPITTRPTPHPTTLAPTKKPTSSPIPDPTPQPTLSPTPSPTKTQTTPPTPPTNSEFTQVRSNIPPTPALDGIYVPMSANKGDRWNFMKRQYTDWFSSCAPQNYGNGQRGGNTAECWRYDPSKTLYEYARRAQLVGDPQAGALADARATAQEFLDRQYFGSSGAWPDCSGGVNDMSEVDKCDMKYWGHASAAWFRNRVDGQPYPYDNSQIALMKEYCFTQGWGGGFVNVDDLDDLYTERWAGLAIQCLVDFYKAGVDVSSELSTAIDYQYDMITGDYSGQVIGAPMHSMDGHECSGYCDNLRYWMFSPWMGSSFLIPALWEYYVFVDRDPRIAQMIVMYGDAMMKYGVVRPDVWTKGARDAREWMLSENPTAWISLYFGNPYDLATAINDQDAEGWYSDLHNAEAIFALSAAYFFSCNEDFLTRVNEMWGFFNQENASENGSPFRIFLWQHRGSASTEWLLENAACS